MFFYGNRQNILTSAKQEEELIFDVASLQEILMLNISKMVDVGLRGGQIG